MNERQFKTYFAAAESIGGDYMLGYRRGLRHHYYDNHGEPEKHDAWMSAEGDNGDGYRDGAAGRPPRGLHANIGNLNAAGDLPADSQLQIRVNSQIKALWVKQAQREGLKLSQWVQKTLNSAAQ